MITPGHGGVDPHRTESEAGAFRVNSYLLLTVIRDSGKKYGPGRTWRTSGPSLSARRTAMAATKAGPKPSACPHDSRGIQTQIASLHGQGILRLPRVRRRGSAPSLHNAGRQSQLVSDVGSTEESLTQSGAGNFAAAIDSKIGHPPPPSRQLPRGQSFRQSIF